MPVATAERVPTPTNEHRGALMEGHQKMTDKVCMFDLDDTLYDYLGQLRRDLESLQSPQDPQLPENLFTDTAPWLRRRMDLIRNQPGWWLNLPRFALGWDIYAVAREIGFSVEVLTKGPRRNFRAWSEKAERVWKDFGPEVAVNIVGARKSHTYARVLVDDYPGYAFDWLTHRPRGLVIMPAQRYNAGISHPQVVRYDGTNLDQVRDAMMKAFSRAQGAPLDL